MLNFRKKTSLKKMLTNERKKYVFIFERIKKSVEKKSIDK